MTTGAEATVRAPGGRGIDLLIGAVLGGAYLALLLSTTADLGYSRDEGFYFEAAKSYAQWFEVLFNDFGAAFDRSLVDRYWRANHEHPALVKSLFALSHHFLYEKWSVFEEQGTAYRFPGMVLSSLGVMVTYLWGSRAVGRGAGVVSAVLLAMMPRVFYHAHLDCFDMPVLTMWLCTSYVYVRSFERGGILWPLLAGVMYGLLLDTKHNSWLLPFALVAHVLVTRGRVLIHDARRFSVRRVPLALVTMATLGPVVFFYLWPWIWNDTLPRLEEYVRFHTRHVHYSMEFLGETYFRPPMPRLYPWVMTLATVPLVTLVLGATGVGIGFRDAWTAWRRRRVASGPPAEWSARDATRVFWLLCILISYAPWLSTDAPIFGGTKHWITAYPFLCLFAGVGFAAVTRGLGERWALARSAVGRTALFASVVLGPVAITLGSHPWGLSSYTPIVGGAPGAATLGLNRTFWGYTTGAIADTVNEIAPKRARVFVHDTAQQSWNMMLRDGRLRRDLRGVNSVAGSDLALYHYEPHMSRVEYMVWVDYGTTTPAAIRTHDGVPVVWVYQRPTAAAPAR